MSGSSKTDAVLGLHPGPVPAHWDELARGVAREFFTDADSQKRAQLHVAIIWAIRKAVAATKVSVLMADAEYEHNTPVRAFIHRAEADALLQSIVEYNQTWKNMPDFSGDPRDEIPDQRAYEKWVRWEKRWNKKHPAGAEWAGYRANFSIIDVELSP